VLSMLEFAFLGGSELYSDSDVRCFARKVTREALREVVVLHVLATRARFGEASPEAHAAGRLEGRVAELISEATPLTAKELALGGRELMQALGMAPGPQVGRLIEHLLEAVLNDPSLNSKERLIELAREHLAGEA
jgi:tRNA nucleotidyltransferase (CCA-adding enzyme)